MTAPLPLLPHEVGPPPFHVTAIPRSAVCELPRERPATHGTPTAVTRWAERSRALAERRGAHRDLRDAMARERVRTRLAMLGLGSPDPLPGAAAQARDLALDLSLRSAAGLLGAPLQALLRPVRVTQAWAIDDVDADDDGPDPTGRPSPRRITFGVIARPTWDRPGTDRPAPGGRLEFSAAVPGASFVGIVDARGWWARGHVRVHRHATLSGDVSATAARVALRTRFGRGIALRADAQYRAQDVEGTRPTGEWRLGFAIEAR